VLLHGDEKNPQVLLTQRALHLKTHAGEVAFPGGMWESIDTDLLQTALREANEEVGLKVENVKPIATLPSASPRRRDITVTPYVALASGPLEVNTDSDEISTIFDVPLTFFLQHDEYKYFDMEISSEQGIREIRFPYINYKDFKIWGFTLKVLTDMLNDTVDAEIELDYPFHSK
jgi:8-oxo-dGTP pyrophosphatase MutT (NUDIX family)